jgi:hypothetical protein
MANRAENNVLTLPVAGTSIAAGGNHEPAWQTQTWRPCLTAAYFRPVTIPGYSIRPPARPYCRSLRRSHSDAPPSGRHQIPGVGIDAGQFG